MTVCVTIDVEHEDAAWEWANTYCTGLVKKAWHQDGDYTFLAQVDFFFESNSTDAIMFKLRWT